MLIELLLELEAPVLRVRGLGVEALGVIAVELGIEGLARWVLGSGRGGAEPLKWSECGGNSLTTINISSALSPLEPDMTFHSHLTIHELIATRH